MLHNIYLHRISMFTTLNRADLTVSSVSRLNPIGRRSRQSLYWFHKAQLIFWLIMGRAWKIYIYFPDLASWLWPLTSANVILPHGLEPHQVHVSVVLVLLNCYILVVNISCLLLSNHEWTERLASNKGLVVTEVLIMRLGEQLVIIFLNLNKQT